METNDLNISIQKKHIRRKNITAAILILFLLSAALFYLILIYEQKPDPVSEKIIRAAAARQLGKYINDLRDEDFEKITDLTIDKSEKILNIRSDGTILSEKLSNQLSDIILLKKFTNLKRLNMGSIDIPKSKTPKWMSLLAKLGIYNVDERYSLDLRPLEKLAHLEKLQLGGKAIKNILPLSKLNLKQLQLLNAQVSDLGPLMNLKNLQSLHIIKCNNISDEQVEELQKALPNLKIYNWK